MNAVTITGLTPIDVADGMSTRTSCLRKHDGAMHSEVADDRARTHGAYEIIMINDE